MSTESQHPPTLVPLPSPRNHASGSSDGCSSSEDSLPRTGPLPFPGSSPFPERRKGKTKDSNHDNNISPLLNSPPLPPQSSPHRSLSHGYFVRGSLHRPRDFLHDTDHSDSRGNMRHANSHSPRRSQRGRRRRRRRPEYWDAHPMFPPPPPSYQYHPAFGYQEGAHPPPTSSYVQLHSSTPYQSYVAQNQWPVQQLYQSHVPPPYQDSPYPSPSSLQPPHPDTSQEDHRNFRTVQHRFAGWVFKIRTDAAPRSKKLIVKRVGDAVEYRCSGALLTRIKYKLQRDLFNLYEDPSADRSTLPFTDPELCSKIEILMACIVADLFEPPWDLDDLNIAWGVSECHDIGDGNSVFVSVNEETTHGAATVLNSLSKQSSIADVTASPYRLERSFSGPLVSRLDAFQGIGSYDRSRSIHSPAGAHGRDQSQIIAVLRRVELITARQLARQSYLHNSEIASVIGIKQNIFTCDHVCGRFDATVPTLFGLLVSKLQGFRRRPMSSDGYFGSSDTASGDSDSSVTSPHKSEHKETNNSDAEPPELVIIGGRTNSAQDCNNYSSHLETIEGATGNSEDESQESGTDPFPLQGSDIDTENSLENAVHLQSNDDLPKSSSEYGKEHWLPGTPLEKHKIKHEHDLASSDNEVVFASITSSPSTDPPAGIHDVALVVDKNALSQLPGHTKEVAVRNDLDDNGESPTQGEASGTRTAIGTVQLLGGKFGASTSTHSELIQQSEQNSSLAGAIKHQDLGGQDDFDQRILESLNDQHNRHNMSSNEGQAQALDPSKGVDGLPLRTKKGNAVQDSGSEDEQGEFNGRTALAEPDQETGNRQNSSVDMSGNEGETGATNARDEDRKPKPILRPPGEPPRRDGTSYRVKFSLSSPERTLTDEQVRRKERQEENRGEWSERRRDDERGCYRCPPCPHAAPRQHTSPSSFPPPPGTNFHAFPRPPEYLSEGPAYRDAVNAGQVYERSFEVSQAQDALQRHSSKKSDVGSSSSIDLELSDEYLKPPPNAARPEDEVHLPTPVTLRRHSPRVQLSSKLTKKGKSGSSHNSSESSVQRISHRSGRNNPAQNVAKELLTVVLGGIIVILSVLAVALDPAEEENWFKRIEQGIFVMFSLGIPFLVAMTSNLSENLEILTPEIERDVRSLRDLQNMNQGMDYDEFVRQLQKAVLLDEDLSALFSFKNACYKLSRSPGKLVVPSNAEYSETFKMVWFFGEDLAFNRILGKVFRYRHENNVLYIDKEPIDIEGVVVHARRRVGKYSFSSAPES